MNPTCSPGKEIGYSSMANSVAGSQPNKACFLVTEELMAERPTNKEENPLEPKY